MLAPYDKEAENASLMTGTSKCPTPFETGSLWMGLGCPSLRHLQPGKRPIGLATSPALEYAKY
ncbi:hypothetical protein EST38_g10901 [Candolleomyces aberdarensis]|uniref:Uncharacterized protein n=1 Tax=Candolleomyces aberdarensis TaxID=2316362 RepID=A0A4Q2D922_9AGAR|nr:hypothetical protein EST38_g10901 [Candolleomyces aberdarensis]